MDVARAHEILRFLIVGVTGFAVDAGLLELFVSLGLAAAVARIFSIALALQVSYLLHGNFTYRSHAGMSRKGWIKFMLSNLVGAVLNYVIFLTVLSLDVAHDPRASRWIALFVAVFLTMGFNYWANRRFAFREVP